MSTEFDAELERRIAEDQGAERERSAAQRRHRFAEVEILAKRLMGMTEYFRYPSKKENYHGATIHDGYYSVAETVSPSRAFELAEDFMAERDRRKAAL